MLIIKATNHADLRVTNLRTNIRLKSIIYLVLLSQSTGCGRAENPGVFRESRGAVAAFSAEVTDPVIRVATFVRLKDGSVVFPHLYFYQLRKSGILGGVRNVEKSGRTYYSLSQKGNAKKSNLLQLPVSKEITEYLLLVRRSFHQDKVPKFVVSTERDPIKVMLGNKTEYVWANWQLLTIPASEISPKKPIVFPSYEELAT